MAISPLGRRSSDLVLGVAGLLLVGLLVVPAVLPSASAQTEGGPTTTTTTPSVAPSTTGGPTTTGAPTTTTIPPAPRPDGQIRLSGTGPFAGNAIYNTSGANQSRTTEGEPGDIAAFDVRVENDSTGPQDIRVVGTAGTTAFTVRYFNGNNNATPQVTGGAGYTLAGLDAGGYVDLRLEIQVRNQAAPGAQRKVTISARSANGAVRDNVVAIAKRPLFSTEQRRIAELVNDSRRSAGRAGLTLHRQLTTKAQAWAEHLAHIEDLVHSNLPSGAPTGWRALAENVGYGRTIAVVHNAFMNSPGHRTNILGPYNFIGTGYAEGDDGRVWIVHVFMRR